MDIPEKKKLHQLCMDSGSREREREREKERAHFDDDKLFPWRNYNVFIFGPLHIHIFGYSFNALEFGNK